MLLKIPFIRINGQTDSSNYTFRLLLLIIVLLGSLLLIG